MDLVADGDKIFRGGGPEVWLRNPQEQSMKMLQRWVEQGPFGDRKRRKAYVIDPDTLPPAVAGLDWARDPSFDEAKALQVDPDLTYKFAEARRVGYAIAD